jgi:hypothetical protein
LPVLSDALPAPWPDWLLAEFRPKPRPRSRCIVRAPDNHLLVKLVQMVAGAREGERNSLTFGVRAGPAKWSPTVSSAPPRQSPSSRKRQRALAYPGLKRSARRDPASP